ncbi:hypothetical protein Clacol_000165 [Clathrus columnatus]|uniref:F-box domain-containing protein n=1 Tax=Clathrus columnatus TaxID=1419009 RepID=A0AAV4ZYN2_9AGAM|nr:hypothetical protein Clacol_000165 [Clathrus columnatus]
MPIISSKKTVVSQKTERDGTEQEEKHKNFLHNLALPINRLPPEILITIINLSLPAPTEIWSYPCLIFSWVCHHWRSVVLGYPRFWNRIAISYSTSKDTIHPMVEEVLLRSQILPLDIASHNPFPLFRELGPHASRIRMLRLLAPRAYDPYPPLSYFTSLFPSLTMLFFEDYYEKIDLSIEPLPRFQALEASIENLGNLALPNNFPNLWWLHLRYKLTFPFIPLLEALHNLPSLRVLSLFPLETRWRLSASDFPKDLTITFHHLEALMTGSPILQLITTPKLLYLECTRYPQTFFASNENYDCFCGFDFSTISHIRVEMNCQQKVYIMGKIKVDTLNEDMTPLLIKKYRKAFDEIPSSYPNEFYIEVGFTPAAPRLLSLFAAIVQKSNNLDKIILNDLNPSQWTSQNDEEKRLFLDALRSAKTVRNLTVSGNEFVTFCEYLNDGTLCPNLERLAYSTHKEQDFGDPLLKLMMERSKMCPQPLEVELTGFSTAPPEALELDETLDL